MVGPLFISSCIRYNSSLSGMEPRENPWGRCEKDADICGDKAAFFGQCKARHAVCWLCGMPIDYTGEKNTSDESYNLDHLYPVSKHAELQFDPAGFRPSHASCNRLRGNQDPPTPIGTLSRQWITTA